MIIFIIIIVTMIIFIIIIFIIIFQGVWFSRETQTHFRSSRKLARFSNNKTGNHNKNHNNSFYCYYWSGQLSTPTGCCVDQEGRVLVANWGNSKIQVIIIIIIKVNFFVIFFIKNFYWYHFLNYRCFIISKCMNFICNSFESEQALSKNLAV